MPTSSKIILAIIGYSLLVTLVNDIVRGNEQLYGYQLIIQSCLPAVLFLSTKYQHLKGIMSAILFGLFIGAFITVLINSAAFLGFINMADLTIFEHGKGVAIDQFSGTHRPDYQKLVAKFYMRSTPLFVLPAVYYLLIKSYLKSSVALLALLLAASRFPTLISLLAVIITSFTDRITKSKLYILLVIPISFIVSTYIVPRTLEVVTSLTSFDNIDSGYVGRFQYLAEFISSLTPIQALLGIGLNTPIYNAYRSNYSGLEFSQLTYLMQHGVIITIFSALALGYICLKGIYNKTENQEQVRSAATSLLAFFFASASQPVLFHPIFVALILVESRLVDQVHTRLVSPNM